MRSWLRAHCLATLALLVSCSDGSLAPRTQLMAVIDAEPELRTQIRRLRVRVQGRAADESRFGPASLDQEYAQLDWPFRVAIVPEGGDVQRRVLVEATAIGAGGEELILLRAISGFLDDRTLALPLYFELLCLAQQCDPEESCARGSCQSAYQDPRSLVPLDKFKPRQPTTLDAGNPGADPDAGPSEPDASAALEGGQRDAAPPEAGTGMTDASNPPGEGSDAAPLQSLCGRPGADASPGEDCPDVVFCGQAGLCDLNANLCCLDSVTANDMCADLTSCGSFWRIECDGPPDCPGGSVCCWEGFNSRCQSQCEAGSVLCHETKDCPTGTCKPGLAGAPLFTWWGFCRQ